MRLVTLILILMLTGCLGSPEPYNPMNHVIKHPTAHVIVPSLWWQLDTSEMKPEDNPWNKFVPTYKKVDDSPKLFPDNWKHKKKKTKPKGYMKYRRSI